MENARIVLFEDNNAARESLVDFLSCFGHEVVAEAASMIEATTLIDSLEVDDANVAVVDGNLSKGSVDSKDGAEIVRQLRFKFGSSIVVIGYSGGDDVAGADLNVGKGGNPTRLIDAINTF